MTPLDPSLAPQQFLPRQYRNVGGFSTLNLAASQTISTTVGLPDNCPGDAGYPIEFDFIATSSLPGLPNAFRFFSNASGVVQATLPAGNYSERISTAAACAAPFLGSEIVTSNSSSFPDVVFPAPIVSGGDGGAIPSLDISGQIVVLAADAGIYSPTVRIRAPPADAGGPPGTILSGDQTLVQLKGDGGLWLGQTFVVGGPAALPVQHPPGGGIVQSFFKTSVQIGAQNAVCQQTDSPDGGQAFEVTCDNFVVELGPSNDQPELPTIDVAVLAPETDGGEAGEGTVILRGTNAINLSFDPTATFAVPILAQGPGSTPEAAVPLTSTVITISTADGGINACSDPDAAICSLNDTATTDPFNGTTTFHVLPGRYSVAVQPRPPLGQSVTTIDVLGGGRLVGNTVAQTPDGGQFLVVAAIAPVAVQGTVHELSADGPLLPAGEIRLLTLPGMALVAQQALAGGEFKLAAPPGQYLLLIEPDATTRFPVYYTDLTVQSSTSSLKPTYAVPAPALLSGIVERAGDQGLPLPVPAYLQFFYVATDGAGDSIAVPVATAVTDSLGRWSAPGPPGE